MEERDQLIADILSDEENLRFWRIGRLEYERHTVSRECARIIKKYCPEKEQSLCSQWTTAYRNAYKDMGSGVDDASACHEAGLEVELSAMRRWLVEAQKVINFLEE